MNRSKIDFRSALSLVLLLATTSGCTICASPDLDSYPTYGGLWHRTDRNHGRVGSLFAPAGVRTQDGGDLMDADAGRQLEIVPPGEATADQPSPSPDADAAEEPEDRDDSAEPEPQTRPDLRDLELDDIDGFLPPANLPDATMPDA